MQLPVKIEKEVEVPIKVDRNLGRGCVGNLLQQLLKVCHDSAWKIWKYIGGCADSNL